MVYTIDMDGDGVFDSADNGIEPFGFAGSGATLSFSDRLKTAIGAAAEAEISCGSCLQYIRSLDGFSVFVSSEIVENLLPNLQLSPQVRDSIGGIAAQKLWLESIIDGVISSYQSGI